MIINVHHVGTISPTSSESLLSVRSRHLGQLPITTFASVEEIPDTFFGTSEKLSSFIMSIELPDQDQVNNIPFSHKIVAAVCHYFTEHEQPSFFKIVNSRFSDWCKNEGKDITPQRMRNHIKGESYTLFLKTNIKEMLEHFDSERFPSAVIDILASI